ncbi:hypothetical protein [Paenibacillus agilis]|uniref:Uncharacterized protein n=1 Tax=Paenibacillus agilis TaxID=3020863 RepID=A0A559IKQ4_9BACL|nr:hypothetical protein [Paenibacillus agilis]TVX88242.1 hypothetical protein FPZ44_20305 [Paenibacillus agilis]
MTTKRKKLFIISVVFIVVILSFTILNMFMKDGNNISAIYGIIKIHVSNNDIVDITKHSADSKFYLSNSKDGNVHILSKMKERGFSFKEQLGSAHVFTSGDEEVIVTEKIYAQNYIIWTVPNSIN